MSTRPRGISDRVKRIPLHARNAYLKASRLLWPSAKPKVVQVEIDGRSLLVLANEDVGRQLVFLRKFEVPETKLLADAVRPGDVCFDVGANTGYYTTLFATRVGDGGSVHAFEPGTLNIHLLRSSITLNELDDIAIANSCALGATVGVEDFSEAVDGAFSSFVPTERRQELRTRAVEVKTLDSYVAEAGLERVDILKADVEGAEKLVIDGGSSLFADARRRPRLVMLELFDPMMTLFATSRAEVIELMREYDYRVAVATERGEPRFVDSDGDIRHHNVFFLAP